ncbi:MAG: AMP-binding protein [Geminicoccaceae bacterium]
MRLPLTDRDPEALLFRGRSGEPVPAAHFLGDVERLAADLPGEGHVLNLCQERYAFLVAFAAALRRGLVTLLSSDQAPARLASLAADYGPCTAVGDPGSEAPIPGVNHREVRLGAEPATAVPEIEGSQLAALVFTSGSTGAPVAHPKPWAALVACTRAASERFGLDGHAVVATVPPQHMYGLETSVLLPLHAPVSSFSGPYLYPEDVAAALEAVPGPRLLVTTPLQLRALLTSGRSLPPLAGVISATAPLSAELAAEGERAWGTRVLEIYGATEVGSIASRRTVDGPSWRPYRTVLLRTEGDETRASVAELPAPVALADAIEVEADGSFRLLGRRADMVKVAGKRASLAALNAALLGIDGVLDGAFAPPEDLDSNPQSRLSVMVVAPDRSEQEILGELRSRISAPFLPRRVIKVAAMPRNAIGKLKREDLLAATAEPFVVAADDPALDGHFEGRPIVPGAVLLAEVLRRCDLPTPVRLKRVKFSGAVLPGDPLDISIERRADGGCAFVCRVRGRQIAGGHVASA